MTENTTDDDTTTEAEVGEAEETPRAGREAAKYRTRLREAEDQLRALTDANRGARVVALLAAGDFTVGGKARLSKTTDVLEFGGATLDELVSPSGVVNQERLSEVLATMHAERPGLFVNTGYRPIPGEGGHVDIRPVGDPLAAALSPRRA